MTGERHVVLGLAPARSAWFRKVAQWAHDGSVALQFVKCVSLTELRAHLASARAFSAVLVDGSIRGVDRDLIDDARTAGAAVLVVDDGRRAEDWLALGAGAVLSPLLSRDELAEVVGRHAPPVEDLAEIPGELPAGPVVAGARADVTTVCGPGGTGASTIAIAAAQAQGDDPSLGGMVLLVDAARRAEQAMLHDAGDVVPGIQEVAESHRTGRPPLDAIRAATFSVPARRYDLLLGLRRPHHWASLRPRAVEATFDSLARAWRAVVVDTDGDAEGAALAGADEVERRNLLTRTAMQVARRVLVVGEPSPKGLYAMAQLAHELVEAGIGAAKLVPVVNRAPRSPIARATVSRALADLLGDLALATAGPTFVPEHRRVEAAIRDVTRLPQAVTGPVGDALALEPDRGRDVPAPVRIEPGTLGTWVETA